MNPVDFIKKSVITELVKQGASPGTAQAAADHAADHYRISSCGGRDAFAELIYRAGQFAMKRQPDFRYVQPKPR
ncbi:hypothetical protein BI096_gp46 [Enterobacter phage Arya]|uniref:Uncharacterized protein n=1 Tax=Enterobacter phage Arya TaxID=1864622 RepID=A0A193GYQ5_9CAUD|nr:hypothetical protein BI096_gp46 [Enterobacter phage Arya]ANN86159.1 hypothetical protein BI096_gp46 [Enterobacter phage Arya]